MMSFLGQSCRLHVLAFRVCVHFVISSFNSQVIYAGFRLSTPGTGNLTLPFDSPIDTATLLIVFHGKLTLSHDR